MSNTCFMSNTISTRYSLQTVSTFVGIIILEREQIFFSLEICIGMDSIHPFLVDANPVISE